NPARCSRRRVRTFHCLSLCGSRPEPGHSSGRHGMEPPGGAPDLHPRERLSMNPRGHWANSLRWQVMALGLALTLLCYRFVADKAAEDARSSFEDACREAQRAIESRLAIYSGLLLGLRGLHEAQAGFTRRQFRNYVGSLNLVERYPA